MVPTVSLCSKLQFSLKSKKGTAVEKDTLVIPIQILDNNLPLPTSERAGEESEDGTARSTFLQLLQP
jgi:hypothetical protein